MTLMLLTSYESGFKSWSDRQGDLGTRVDDSKVIGRLSLENELALVFKNAFMACGSSKVYLYNYRRE